MKQEAIRLLQWRPGRIIGAALAVLIAAAFIVGPAAGQGLSIASAVQADEVIDNDLLLTGFEGVIDGTVMGNVFATGKEVTVNGDIEGSLFVIGDKLAVNGNVAGGTYAIGVSLEQGSSSVIDLNLYFLGINLRTESGAVIGRDLTLVALSANLAGEVDRDTRAVVGLLEFIRLIGDGLGQGVLGKPIVGLAPADLGAAATGIGTRILGRPTIVPGSLLARTSSLQAVSTDELIEIGINCIRALVSFLLVGFLALWLKPKMFNGATAELRQRPLASAGYGALVFVNGFLLTLLLGAAIVGVGLGLRALTLTSLAWGFWGVAFSSLGLAFSIFVVSLVWLSKAIVAAAVGIAILERVYPRALEYRVSAMTLGLLIFLLLCLIPVVGLVIAMVVSVIGLGAIFLSIRQIKRDRKPAAKRKK